MNPSSDLLSTEPTAMNRVLYILLAILLSATLTACSAEEGAPAETGMTHYPLVLSIGQLDGTTRQGTDIVQDEGQPFRGLQDVTVLPFNTSGPVTATDFPMLSGDDMADYNGGRLQAVTGRNYYYVEDCPMLWDTNHVLIYGRAQPKSGASLAENGTLTATVPTQLRPANITFSLPSIRDSYDIHDDAQALADYLTAIANTTGWSTTAESTLKVLYENFINLHDGQNGQMPASARHVRAYVAALREQVEKVTGTLSTAIIATIDDATLSACLANGYPSGDGSLGLPDGAAAIRWTGSRFEVKTQTTTLDNINGIIRYVRPAELWYYVNSTIHTSDQSVGRAKYEAAEVWDDLVADSYQSGTTVTKQTRAVAVDDALQYGVGRLQLTLSTITGTLKDAREDVIDYGNDPANLPLTAVVVGGQHTVGFDFKPRLPQSDVDVRFIYDPIVGTTGTVNTLVLQSYDNEKVPVAIELQNNTGRQFAGRDGIVYPGTRFYLIGEIDPAGQGTGDFANRVFTQDYTTKITMRVTSLANAYCCLPDLLSGRLEVGVELTSDWVQATTTVVPL